MFKRYLRYLKFLEDNVDADYKKDEREEELRRLKILERKLKVEKKALGFIGVIPRLFFRYLFLILFLFLIDWASIDYFDFEIPVSVFILHWPSILMFN